MFTKRRVALVATLVALLMTVPTVARANHDPDPPYLSSSQPDGYELFGFHHKQLSPTVHAWAGIQRRGSDGFYRAWWKVQGDGRQLAVEYNTLVFTDHGYASYTACQSSICTKGPSPAAIYYVGAWHPVADEVSVKANGINARYIGGASTGFKCVASYRMLRGSKTWVVGPGSC